MYDPVSTYRIQFHKAFNFSAFERIIPYLNEMGVKTIYASPIFAAVPGSLHGYDVVDPLTINPEIGSLEQLRAISRTLRKMGIGWLQDIVPNHMAFHPVNRWLMDVLEKGEHSFYARFFDILWDKPGTGNQLMVPFLGTSLREVISNEALKIIYRNGGLAFRYADQFYPLSLSSSILLLERYENATAFQEFKKAVLKLEKTADEKKYSRRSDSLKQIYLPFFDDVFTVGFLKNVNSDKELLTAVAAKQHYRLCHWQETDQRINYRRFFTVNGLLCLNMQDEFVFDHYHQLTKKLLEEQVFQGLRVDHIDGLYDPGTYLERLRILAGPGTYIVVEKILEDQELFPGNWPVQGNTGYDFLADTNNLFTFRSSKKAFTTFYHSVTKDRTNLADRILVKKRLFLQRFMAGELENLDQLFYDLKLTGQSTIEKATPAAIKDSIAGLLIHCPVYRYYGRAMPLDETESVLLKQLLETVEKDGESLHAAVAMWKRILLINPKKRDTAYRQRALRFYQRLMQFSGPLMAKGVEDTLMYSYNRFIDHNEVGDSPGSYGLKTDLFSRRMIKRAQHSPLSMNATATHDTKRGEDVRARLNVLTAMADEWISRVKTWQKMNVSLKTDDMPEANDEYFIYQTLVGALPMPGQDAGDFAGRMQEYMSKALREAKINSDWAKPNEAYEEAVKTFISGLLNKKGAFWQDFSLFHQHIADFGIINSLAQVLLKYTSPGIPDLYQGAELWDLSLVDPDNRRPVDYDTRQKFADQKIPDWKQLWENKYNGHIKLRLTQVLLKERRGNPETFLKGEFIPLEVKGKYKDQLFAFARRYENSWYVSAFPLHLLSITGKLQEPLLMDWRNTRIILPAEAPRNWENLLTGDKGYGAGDIRVTEIFKQVPLSLLKLELSKNERGAGV